MDVQEVRICHRDHAKENDTVKCKCGLEWQLLIYAECDVIPNHSKMLGGG